MRYYTDKPKMYISMYGQIYKCDHPVYNSCTLYLDRDKGLAVIQQRYNPRNKTTYWTGIDDWLTDKIYLNEKFREFFQTRSGVCKDGLYPTVTIRQIMWALKMKPLKRERWETCFDRREI